MSIQGWHRPEGTACYIEGCGDVDHFSDSREAAMSRRDEALEAMDEATSLFLPMTGGRFNPPNDAALDGLVEWLREMSAEHADMLVGELVRLLRRGKGQER